VIVPVFGRLLIPRRLSMQDARRVFDVLVAPPTTDAERAALLMALSARPDDGMEWATLAGEMRRRAVPFRPRGVERAMDLCGSGGAPRPSFNISTVSAFVVAAGGQPVIKHGNRSARGPCGSSDLLRALGVPVDASRAFPRITFERLGLAFLHAPLFHPATAAVAPARRMLGVPTVFNRLGPLSSPARVRTQVVGWSDRAQAGVVREALRRLGVRRGLTMTSDEGCDEFSPRQKTRVTWWAPGRSGAMMVDPHALLVAEDRRGPWGAQPPASAAAEAERILAGGGGARRGSILLTVGASLWIAGRARSMRAGVARATEVLDTGAPERLLEKMRELGRPFLRRAGR
jgi:anthranilate phosphoribosyltransferase